MMMAEAIAMSASKRTLCLRRSILRMRFIAAACQSGSVASAALAGTSMLITSISACRPHIRQYNGTRSTRLFSSCEA